MKTFRLEGAGGKTYESSIDDSLGSVQNRKHYGVLKRPAAMGAITKSGDSPYTKHRIFSADEGVAIAAGYRPCAACMPAESTTWKSTQAEKKPQ